MSLCDSRIEMSPVAAGDDVNSTEFTNAKAYLLQSSSKSGENLYDHLTKLLTTILDEKPVNVADTFEDLSRRVRCNKFESNSDILLEKPDKTRETVLAELQQSLFVRGDGGEGQTEVEEQEISGLPNLLELNYYFEQADIGLNREEIVRIWLALKSLVETQPAETVRFWGKILGIEKNYIIAEVEFREGEGDEEENEPTDEGLEDQSTEKDIDAEAEENAEVDYIPKPLFKPPPTVPREEHRTGANKKTYFVCNEPGEPWVRLPLVTPAQVSTARMIRKFFTGRLDAPIVSNPPFPGTEMNYLRAQIARITASTHISPVGFYQFDEEEDEGDDGHKTHVLVNVEFEPLPVRDLVDPSLANWVHHVLHILPQGRTTWWNPVQKSADDADDNDDEEDKEEQEVVEPEVGPPLLTPLSEDAEVNGLGPWTTRISSKLVPQYAIAVVQSCLWPGAHAFASGRTFENIYIGWGHKYLSKSYSPPAVPPVQCEYPNGPEITETIDPSPEEEAALRAANAPEQDAEADDDALEEGAIAEEDGGDDEDEDD